MTNHNLLTDSDPVPPELDPMIVELAKDPLNESGASAAERRDALTEAERLASVDKMRNRRIVEKDGELYWAAEYPNVFTFNGQLRGKFDWVHKDPSKRSGAQQIASIGGLEGKMTDVIIEMDDGEQVIIRKRNDAVSSQLQEFDLVSTNMAKVAAAAGTELEPRKIPTDVLAEVVVVPGLPMRLGLDPTTGTAPRTRGNVVRITGLALNESGKVSQGHPDLNKPDKRTDAREKFNAAIRTARRQKIASAAIRHS